MIDGSAGVRLPRNLGRRRAAMLELIGIATVGDLRASAPVAAFRRLRLHGAQASLALLWAMAAGLQGRDWRSLTGVEKRALLDALQV